MIAAHRRPWFPSLVVLFVLGCSNGSSSSSSGCGSSSTNQVCSIELTATTCPGKVTLECDDGAKPSTKSRCVVAIMVDTQTVYCCDNNADLGADGGGGGGR